MTDWLAGGDAPGAFTIDRDCELKSPVEEKAAVRYVRHTLEGVTCTSTSPPASCPPAWP